jgi:hypothetical protein
MIEVIRFLKGKNWNSGTVCGSDFDKITLLNSRISIYRTNIYMLGVVSEAR